ncbi:unnamed protein product [Microthlaspi erraticum]|uniref:F-box domain-containing protein n=1 Tax=Microthlaspi erraticum TaxID=1685480 RepID=A0A6D2K0R7_9BRAS|nr:unnamed protein product [Microthlaspi erraticum]
MDKNSNLPEDLIEEILSRVPTKSLARFRATSKRWNSLSKTGRFANKHSASAPKESLPIMLIGSRLYLVNISLLGMHGNDNVAPSVNVGSQFHLYDPRYNSSRVDIRDVFHCDGLLLCTTKDRRHVVCNPCSGETKWIKPSSRYKETDYYALGYGYDTKSSCKQYKILKVDCQDPLNRNENGIYDLTSDSWRNLGVATDWSLVAEVRGVSVKGNTYWIALAITLDDFPNFLLSFDFSTERFQSRSLPRQFKFSDFAVLSVVREEKLCLLGGDSRGLNVLVTDSIGVMSWSKFLRKINVLKLGSWMSFLVDEENKVVVCCKKYPDSNRELCIVGEDKYALVDHYGGDLDPTCRPKSSQVLMSYVPSLAQIQQTPLLPGHKRKRTKHV